MRIACPIPSPRLGSVAPRSPSQAGFLFFDKLRLLGVSPLYVGSILRFPREDQARRCSATIIFAKRRIVSKRVKRSRTEGNLLLRMIP